MATGHKTKNQCPASEFLVALKPNFFSQSSFPSQLTEWKRTVNFPAIRTVNPLLNCERERPKGEYILSVQLDKPKLN